MTDKQASHCLVVGFFKDQAHARQARTDLAALGVDARADFDADLSPDDAVQSARQAYGSGLERTPTVSEAVGDLFRSLFVDFGGPSAYDRLYDAAQPPAWLVAARCASAQERDSVSQALQRHGGQDVRVLPLAH